MGSQMSDAKESIMEWWSDHRPINKARESYPDNLKYTE